jgi:outer membrane lipoprotein-sorting protein
MSIRTVILFFVFSLIAGETFSQEFEIEKILDSTKSVLAEIESYSVDATFNVDIDFVNMPDKKATIHFKSPDKIDVESDGFLMIPKIGLKPMTKQLDLENYHSIFVGEEDVNGALCYAVKMIPKDRKSKIVLSTLWIDIETYSIRRWESYAKKAGNILVDLEYDGLILPSKLIFSFELSGMNIPVKYFGSEVEIDKAQLKDAEKQQGKVHVTFENYKINYFDQTE